MWRLCLIFLVSILLTACGFHLYNKNSFPQELHNMYLQTDDPYNVFNIALKHALHAMDVNLTATKDAAAVTLNIVSIKFTHDDPNISSSSQATVYNFTYSVTFDLQDKQGKLLVKSLTISTSRTLTLNPNEVLEASTEVSSIQEEMQRDLILQLISCLDSDNTKAALGI